MMKIKICDRCQFRMLEAAKYCQTCGSTQFTAYEVSDGKEPDEVSNFDWKRSAAEIWNWVASSFSKRDSSADLIRDFPSTVKDET
ncbi:MAG TPA: hypothetical protein EYN91_02245 [Candidatus Melainabacteria bacterium]|jgi:hypothetical protein|nr:hypothetical protein [Candidatus Melainabacteria bacterium]HIN63847.1 hypothetical protein [Candidatus Obscuribacterales bacterium]